MSSKQLHVVSFDIPFPADYGGVIDVFYKLKALHKAGVAVYLHCFAYGRKEAAILDDFCTAVYYYPRIESYKSLPFRLPHIVASRQHPNLLKRLVHIDAPILFEGLHTCYYLSHPLLKTRQKMVRMHNIEWHYYGLLAKGEKKRLKKLYCLVEAYQLKRFEKVLQKANRVFAISNNDLAYLEQHFPHTPINYLPAFHPNEQVNSLVGKGDYLLYHGNLSVAENHQAALYLIEKVLCNIQVKVVIAGKNPRPSLLKAAKQYTHIKVVANPSNTDLTDLIRHAQVHVLPTFQATGIKLKLLNALYNGRFCLVNSNMVNNTDLASLCHIADTPEAFKSKVLTLVNRSFEEKELTIRQSKLNDLFNNATNIAKIVNLL